MPEPQAFRQRPIEIEAMQWDGTAEGATPIIDWILTAGSTARYHEAARLWNACIQIDTSPLSAHTVNPRDWIVLGPLGQFHPCAADLFAATHEPAVQS